MKYIVLIIVCLTFSSCGKEFLDVKRDKGQVVPSTIADFQALLDDASNTMNNSSSHELGVLGADEYTLSDQTWENLSYRPYEKNAYIWANEVYENNQVNDWNSAYRRVLYANTALLGINNIQPLASEKDAWSNVKGSALFFRAFNFYQLAQLFCKPYSASADADPGIPLRLDPDINLKTGRANVAATYAQIISDLNEASSLLPVSPVNLFRPSKPAVYALMAKTYLQMGQYEKAEQYASLSLALKGSLINYNSLSTSADYTFPLWGQGNPEVLLMCNMLNIAVVTTTRFNASPELLGLYASNDLRRKILYKTDTDGRILFKGSYAGLLAFFTGLSVDETLLIRAECYLRAGRIDETLADLNFLLKNRITTAGFQPLTVRDSAILISRIVEERRKELALRGVRWEDLRRYNKEPALAKIQTRLLKGTTYQLLPNVLKYVWPIPQNAIETGGYEQNPR
ncbi:RagB/SusD domain-containing protein [Mucilaginibacter pineti]|uniref:RagB/SusD domain-containing protein n=1 Tax=Mucilaginibacter pineti TaxID=1391627 RepID=A0A1G7H2W3_9SPHI|nr:RagB/SusD family nutrient uptake outer membrane protein [Mucilaginibacter pineti]SDE94691.1 RagB/SusD domain-containing protein [Mucilaginibacter pineti]